MTTPPGLYAARLIARRPESARGQILVVAPEVPVGHTEAGQYCALGVPVGHASTRFDLDYPTPPEAPDAFFAIASAPGPGPLEFYVQPAGGVSDLLIGLPLGSELRLGPPLGPGYGLSAALAHGGPLHALATGSGLSGLRAALIQLHAAGRTVHLRAGFRTPDHVLFAHDLEGFRRAGSTIELLFSQPDGARVQGLLAAQAPDLRDAWVLACGQWAMQEQARVICAGLGLRPERFLTNY